MIPVVVDLDISLTSFWVQPPSKPLNNLDHPRHHLDLVLEMFLSNRISS